MAEPVPVHHMEGTVQGFLALRTTEGKTIAAGGLTQVVQGNRLVSRLTFRFKDGSVDDETTVFSQERRPDGRGALCDSGATNRTG